MCCGLTGVISQVSLGLPGKTRAEAKKVNSRKSMPVEKWQNRHDKGTKKRDCRVVVSVKLK